MSPKPNVTAQRTAQIIKAATAVFAAQGFDGATMDDIAEAASIKPPSTSTLTTRARSSTPSPSSSLLTNWLVYGPRASFRARL
ncbi:MAG: helix-turn-helix transcriptional regulator [Thermoflexales bacterium]|nr:helix-turn-helix transcriptional regulator [Thermoflexales bacterium]